MPMLQCDHYLMPASLEEAFDLMDRHRGRYRIVAGATDLLPGARQGKVGDVRVPVLIDVSRVEEMTGAEPRGGRMWLGANIPFAKFIKDPRLRGDLPLMERTAVRFADDQIREMATVGGNIVNASPAADSVPPLLALNGELTLVRRSAGEPRERRVPLERFITGPGTTGLEDGELLTGITCDRLEGYGSAFEKVGYRRSLIISTVCVAAAVRLDAAGTRFEDVRLALGAVGPVPARLTECETFLAGKPVEPSILRAAAELPLHRVQSRTRRDYRREVVAHLVRRALEKGLAMCSEGATHGDQPGAEAAHG